MKLRDLLNSTNKKIKLNEGWSEQETSKMTTDDKKDFLEAVGNFNQFGKSIYRESNFQDMTEAIGKMLEQAKQVALTEGDWFDGVTVQRHMKGLGESYKMFEKTAKEMSVLQQRMEAVYEDMGGTLGKYFNINEIAEAMDTVGKEDDDINNDGEVDNQDDYLATRRAAVSNAIDDEDVNESI
jgi:hypothetical protein